MAWQREDLSASAQPVKMVSLHHPPFDPDGSDHPLAFHHFLQVSIMNRDVTVEVVEV